MLAAASEPDDDRDADDGNGDGASVDGGQRACQRLQFRNSSPGSFVSVMPSRSLIWLAKMTTAMPAVNPTVTG